VLLCAAMFSNVGASMIAKAPADEFLAIQVAPPLGDHGRRAVAIDQTSASTAPPRQGMALVKPIARANHWRQMLLSSEVDSTKALVPRLAEGQDHLARTLNLAF
jgi:hypothetical protein